VVNTRRTKPRKFECDHGCERSRSDDVNDQSRDKGISDKSRDIFFDRMAHSIGTVTREMTALAIPIDAKSGAVNPHVESVDVK
jgi:hypothetical protein